ncbi:hypothetical protein UFOVP908_154 [uncultured Caudovirales phage]|uniref:Uncharacterized protein n=1 Tax=uncultured Caudovirales phage TaxID=2100421 RepID=A0A6J5QC12_9CAUD|nr:hypothetical protein UFOVP908_154 [uncultured Caudovirales phage]CAB4177164.1 hypothetical protein UFOVP990_215 [uncultured Caudovirales phage]CAB4181190.1 hypothetical protein UFOVP1065_13 [uncultured Caudovirales phage]CAB4190875.1 hypothetical protein UFOVP1198_215 [uncultured Caudovirales phage]CAB4211226.1 hypothetical protein UFOVP1418_207 [uncultured Caudovirales phage]
MYTNTQYIKDPLVGEVFSIRCDINGVTSFVPLDPANTDYQNIMALVEKSQLTIAPAEDKE